MNKMMKTFSNLRKNSPGGFTILEVLIAGVITAIIAAATFSFYVKMQGQTEHQFDVSELHQLCRTSLHDIRGTLMQAGFKLSAHPAYEIKGDTLAVYYNDTQPVDTILYYLVEFTTAEYSDVGDLPVGHDLYKLVKKVNSGAATVYADFLTTINYNQIDAANIIVTMTVHSMRMDESYLPNDGFRLYSVSERINVRNI